MARYVLMFEGEVLVGVPDDHSLDQVGHEPFKNIRKAKDARKDWAAELGGCAGDVRE